MRKRFLLSFIAFGCVYILNAKGACPDHAAEIEIINSSTNVLELETKEEEGCVKRSVAKIKPGTKGKYCIAHDYVLKITTYSLDGNTRLAVTATDVWNDMIITTPKDSIPDVEIKHLRLDKRILNSKASEGIKHQVLESNTNPISNEDNSKEEPQN